MIMLTESTENESSSNLKRKHDQEYESSSDEEHADDEVSGDSEVETNEDVENIEQSNAGWADSISKILKSKKPKKKKNLVLSKAKKLTDIPKVQIKPVGFEVETTGGEIKEETIEVNTEVDLQTVKKKRRELPKVRVKPNILEKDRERTLQKIATKGVVQLFNAVRMQQKDVTKKLEEAGPLEVRKEKVLKSIDKRAFLDILMGEKSQKVDEHTDATKTEDTSNVTDSTWSVLRDDFMMGVKMKDWDKELETENVEEVEQEIECESE